MKTCSCGKMTSGSTVCLVLYDKKVAGGEKKTTEVLGAVETVCCESCLVRNARKSMLKSILGFLVGIIIISVVAGLINGVFRLSWVGGGILVVLLLGILIKNIAETIGKTQKNGAALEAFAKYKKQGYIPATDFFYLTREGNELLKDGDLALKKTDTFDPADMMLITDWALEESLKKAPNDSAEVTAIRADLAECSSRAPSEKLSEPMKIRKAFYKPIPAFFLIVITLAVSVLVFVEGFDVKDSYFFFIGGAMFILGFIGAVMLVLRRRMLWYLPIVAMIALFWIADTHIWGEDLRYHLEEPVVISLVVFAAALCWLPYVNKEKK